MDLTTTYMGLNLKHPVVPSASPVTKNLDNIRRLEDAGAPAIVMYSLFEEQITKESHRLDHFLSYGTDSYSEAMSYFPDLNTYNVGPDEYLNLIQKARAAVNIPIIGSLNGISSGGWVEYAQKIQEAGAHALELNVYYIPTDPHLSGGYVEQMYLDVLADVKEACTIPVSMKLGPFFSSPANMAHRLAAQGVNALVLFNRFYQPDFDLENLEVVPHLVLSDSNALRLPLRWVAILYGRVPVDFAITSGVHTHEDVLKGLMAGAAVTMMTSELLQHGLKRINEVVADMTRWMEEREYVSVKQMQGSMSQKNVAEPAAFERANYMKVLQSWRFDPTGSLF
ncbi:MAG: dihydroorotate dehydrogenase-like protein [Blastocatellia bacterium]|nr:dihydroorotate dehydrogenase-like protein [Blastocatellia bacterium]